MVPVVERTPKGCLRDSVWSQEPFERSSTSRTRILLPQHRTVPVEHINVDIATILYVLHSLMASRLPTAPSVHKSSRANPYG